MSIKNKLWILFIKNRVYILLGITICLIAATVFAQKVDKGDRRGSFSRGERDVGRTEKDPNSIEEKEQTLEQRVESLEKELNKLTSRIKILELDNEILFFELITFRATVYRENIINDIQKNRDTRTQEEKWNDYGYYPIIIRNGE